MTTLQPTSSAQRAIRRDPWYVRWPLIAFTVLFLGLMVVLPMTNVFVQGFEHGLAVVLEALVQANTLNALKLTLLATVCAVGFNLSFGLAAAWAIARFRFPGKALLNALIDLPFSISPVIAGMIFVLLFGSEGYIGALYPRAANVLLLAAGGWVAFVLLPLLTPARWGTHTALLRYGVLLALPLLGWFLPAGGPRIPIVFAIPGILLATTFVTFPFIARELIPVMEALGPEEEEAARTLGASGWQMFWHVTLPNIKWGLLYGVLLCNARALGEFGAVSVVVGQMRGRTETLPIMIKSQYDGMGSGSAVAFAVSGLLCCLALVMLLAKNFLEWKARQAMLESTKGTAKEPS